jgi:type VI secretion system protein ImpK
MDDDFDRDRRGAGRRAAGSRRRSGPDPDDDEDDPRDEAMDGEDDYDDEPAPRSRRRTAGPAPRGGAARGRQRPSRGGSSWSLFGGSKQRPARKPARAGGRMDWGAAQDQEYEEDDRYAAERRPRRDDDYEEDDRPRRRASAPASKRRERLTLMDLCTPVFGYAAILPRDSGGIHPGYQQFRKEILTALQRIESEGPDHELDREDCRQAVYALALFMDEQVGESEWSGKMEWFNEPLGQTLLQDPEGGVNFYSRLDSLGDRQRAVKEVFLVCLSLGFRGKYIELEPTQQAARIGEIRQKLIRSINPSGIDTRRVLFPEAYTPALPLEDEAPPPPRWWMAVSLGVVVLAVIIWALLYWSAGGLPVEAAQTIRRINEAAP